jgi:hypothetical protein
MRLYSLAVACSLASTAALAGQQMQGQQMQGQQMQGQQMQGTSLSGSPAPLETPVAHSYSGWFLQRHYLQSTWISQGQIFAIDHAGHLLSGQALIGAFVPATQGSSTFWTQIHGVASDPTFSDGSTALYDVQIVNADGSLSPLCGPDLNGVAAAIPVATTFDATGARVESSSQFTFGCTAGVIAKCYRWGYRPWVASDSAPAGEFAQLHWACTRLARADYCGNGQSWTQNGTLINVWDYAPAPGPFQQQGTPPADFFFEAGWNTKGAVCLSKQRWLTLPPAVAQSCPDRLIPPGMSTSAGTVCDTDQQALQFDSTTQLFNQSRVNVAQ